MQTTTRKRASLGARILARAEANDRARRRTVTLADASFAFDYGFADFGGDNMSGPRASYFVRPHGAFDTGSLVTQANQVPDQFGQYRPSFAADGLGTESPDKTVAEVKQLCDVVAYRQKLIEPAVYAVVPHNPDYGPLRSDYLRFRNRVMNGLQLAQKAILMCARTAVQECDAPAETAYNALVRALRQGGTPSSPVQRGDFDDLVQRVQRAGVPVDLSLAPEFSYEPPSAAGFGYESAGFGAIPGPSGMIQTISDVNDLLANWDPRMKELNAQSQGVGDSDFMNDLAGLNTRYNKAVSDAKSAISDSSWNPLPASMIPADNAYQSIVKALKQDPSTISKGDFDDLYARLSKVKAVTLTTVQPTTQDVGDTFYKATAPYDLISQWTGQEAPKTFVGGKMSKGQKVILLVATAVGGVFAVHLFVLPTVKAAVGLAAAVAGGYIGYKAVGEASKLGSSPGAKLLGL